MRNIKRSAGFSSASFFGRIFVVILMCYQSAAYAGIYSSDINYDRRAEGRGTVYRVIDGDTIIINVQSSRDYSKIKGFAIKSKDRMRWLDDKYRSFRIRIANIDTPESVHKDKTKNTREGELASKALKKLVEGRYVEYTCWDFGRYGRAICSVSVGGYDVGAYMINQGFSDYVTKYGRHPYLDKSYKMLNNK